MENAVTLFQELLRRRRKKILNLVLIASETGISKQDFDNMLLIEKSLFEDLMKCIDASDRKLSDLLNGAKDELFQKNQLIVFSADVEEFIDATGGKMGPFSKGEMANMPKEVAGILIGDAMAESMEK